MGNIFKDLTENLNLGNLICEPTSVHGGALHKIWLLKTEQAEYVVKEINPYITKKITFPQSYESSEEIAAAFNKQDIPAVCAKKIHNHFVHQLHNQWFIIYSKVSGKILYDLTEKEVSIIGKIFAKMHKTHLVIQGVDSSHYDKFSNEHWRSLIKEARNSELDNLYFIIAKWNDLFSEAIPILNENLKITHRDLHHKNVLWKNDQPWIIDWESSGLMNPIMEMVGYGIEWAGILSGNAVNKSLLSSFLSAYHNNINEDFIRTPIKCAFYGWLGHCVLGWTEFNLRRMFGEISTKIDEITLGNEIIKNKMIPALNYLVDNEKHLIEYLRNKLEFY